MNQPINAIPGRQGFQEVRLPEGQRASAPAPGFSPTGSFKRSTGGIDADVVAATYQGERSIDDLKEEIIEFSAHRDAWQAQHPGWTITGCDSGNFDTPVSITVSDPNGLSYEITRDDVDELVVEHNYEYVNDPPVELADDDNGIGDTYDSLAYIGRTYGYPAVDAINPALQNLR